MIENAFAFACEWYKPDDILMCLQKSDVWPGIGRFSNIPSDTKSREFAEWLTNEYRLAMAKGIEIGQRDEQTRQAIARNNAR